MYSVNEKKSDISLHVRDWWKRFSFQEESQLVGGGRKNIKNGDPHRNGDELKILKVTNREVKACKRVNVKRSIHLLNVECNLSFFHKTLSS